MGFALQPIKLLNPTGEFVSGLGTLFRQFWHNVAAPDNVSVHAAVTLPASGTTVVTTAIVNPAAARVARVKGNASGIVGNVVIAGLDQFGAAATDTVALSGASAVDGVVAFSAITSITVPAKTNSSGDTVSVGRGAALGLARHLSVAIVFGAAVAGVQEGTAPTMNATYHTASFATAADGTKDFVIYVPHEDLSNA